MALVDLHIHTTMSDGQYTPAQVIRQAAQAGITLAAITDHDTVNGLEEGAAAAAAEQIRFLPGIEISVRGSRELHILGYCIKVKDPGLQQMNAEFSRLRKQRETRILEFLDARGVHLSEKQIRRHATGGLAGRPHFARAMVESGYVSSFGEAFDKYLATPEFQKLERPKPSAREGIEVIRGAGGVAVIAHPVSLCLEGEALDRLVAGLVADGVQGIECYYSTHTPVQTESYLKLAERYDLLITGGSDYHGEKVKPDIRLGTGIRHSIGFTDDRIDEKLIALAWKNRSKLATKPQSSTRSDAIDRTSKNE